MPVETQEVEYRTVPIGGALLVKGILNRLNVIAAIDQPLQYQPEIAATYGRLAQAVIINRMSYDPQPLYQLPEWVRISIGTPKENKRCLEALKTALAKPAAPGLSS